MYCVWYMCTVSSMIIFLINEAECKLKLPVIKSISRVCNYMVFLLKPQMTYSVEDRLIFMDLRIYFKDNHDFQITPQKA